MIASKVSDFLVAQKHFTGKVWLCDSVESYVVDDLLREKDDQILDALSGVMAETNAYFDDEFGHYDVADIVDGDDR